MYHAAARYMIYDYMLVPSNVRANPGPRLTAVPPKA